MKTLKFIALLSIAAAPAMLSAASDMDRKIEDAAKSSYNFRVVFNDQVTAKSEDGAVTLTGTVQDKDQKSVAEDTVSNLPGVVSVNDQIQVAPPLEEHSDAWIALKIRGLLLVRANVSVASTKVDVTNGVVLLTGTVDNRAQKDLTEAYAKEIEGVKSVKNELVINAPPADAGGQTFSQTVDDASITAQVKYALLSHRSTSAFKTSVTTKDGVVRITGQAGSGAEKDLVTTFADSVRGVKSVDNQMTVNTN